MPGGDKPLPYENSVDATSTARWAHSEFGMPPPIPPDTYNRDWNRRGGVYPRPALNPPILPLGVIPREVPQAPSRGIHSTRFARSGQACGEMSQRACDFSIDPSIRFRLRPTGFAVTSRSLGMTSVNRRAINLASAGGATYMRAGACGSRRRPGSVAPSGGSFMVWLPIPGAHAPGYISVAPPALIPTTHISRAAERRKMISLGREPQEPGDCLLNKPLEGATDLSRANEVEFERSRRACGAEEMINRRGRRPDPVCRTDAGSHPRQQIRSWRDHVRDRRNRRDRGTWYWGRHRRHARPRQC
jgi:hypothetical protein